MDPSLSGSNDPHIHPPPFTAFPNPFSATQHPFYVSPAVSSAVAPPNNNNNNQFFQTSPHPHPAWNHPPYSEMICCAITALNEADGSSKQAISRYIERTYTGIPTTHGALMTHHLKSLKNSGVLVMVKKSYKLAPAAPPTSSVAVAPGFELPRSDFASDNSAKEIQPSQDLAQTSTQKRGRGRPPKAKPDVAQTNGKRPDPRPEEQVQPLPPPQPQLQALQALQAQPLVKRPPGRPRKDGASPTVKTTPPVSGGLETAKRRGRPPSGRAAGRERKPAVVSAPASVFPVVAGASSSSLAPPPPPPPPPPQPKAEGGGSQVAKRGRGRPPKIGGVMRKPMKPKRGYIRTGRPLGRPRKNAVLKGVSRQQDILYGELKKKFELFQAKAKDIVYVLKAELGGTANQAVVQAMQALEELTITTTEKPQHMEEVEPYEQPHGSEPETAHADLEAMQEALF